MFIKANDIYHCHNYRMVGMVARIYDSTQVVTNAHIIAHVFVRNHKFIHEIH